MPYCQQHLYILRGLQKIHAWVAAGMSAIEVHGMPHPWSQHDGLITIASKWASSNPYGGKRYATPSDAPPNSFVPGSPPAILTPVRGSKQPLRRLFITNDETVTVRGIRTTSLFRTVFDAVMLGTFDSALECVNHVLRTGISKQDLRIYCAQLHANPRRMDCILKYATPLAENGGESMVLAAIIREGFAIPELQHEFTNFENPSAPLRSDFYWKTTDGRIIVLEFDGLGKYSNPSMTRRAEEENITRQARRDKMLFDQGVSEIIHCFSEDIYRPDRLVRKLVAARVPRLRHARELPF